MVKFPNGIIDIRSMCTLSLKVHLEIHVVRLTPTLATSHFKTWTWNFMPRGFDHWFWNPKWFLSCSLNENPPILNLRILIFFSTKMSLLFFKEQLKIRIGCLIWWPICKTDRVQFSDVMCSSGEFHGAKFSPTKTGLLLLPYLCCLRNVANDPNFIVLP